MAIIPQEDTNPLPALYNDLRSLMAKLAETFGSSSPEQLGADLQEVSKLQTEIQKCWSEAEPLRGLSVAQKQHCKNLLIETESINASITQLATSHMAALRNEEQSLRVGRTTLSSYKSTQTTSGRIVSVSS